MELFAIHTQLIQPKSDLVRTILEALDKQELKVSDGDILAIASKAVAIVQGRLAELDSVRPSQKAKEIAGRYNLDPSFAEVVLREATRVYGGVPKTLLTLKENILGPNAGVDRKNAPIGYVALWPTKPFMTAQKIAKEILARTGKRVGTLIVDSRVTPLRMGTTGLALAVAGFEPVRDCRTDKDLYGKSISITRHALADDLASAAHLIMGESNEQTPAVLIRNAPIKLADKVKPSSVLISAEQCLFAKHMMRKAVRELS